MEETPKYPIANIDAHQFINWWIKSQPNGPVGLVDKLRNKTLNLTDASELRKYLKREGVNDKIFGNIEDSIRFMEYHCYNPKWITAPVVWINQERLRGCRKIGKDAMWDCLKQDYHKTDYYYLSIPIFSSDHKWAMLSVNYMESESQRSCGGGRLFKRINNINWEEVALLSGWGHFD